MTQELTQNDFDEIATNRSISIRTDSDGIVSTRVVILYILAILQSVCGYYIPMSAMVLWWAVGIGAFVLGLLYLQYLYSTHFFVDAVIANLMEQIIRKCVPVWCSGYTICYSQDAQDMMAFFFTVATHVFIYGPRPASIWNSSVFVIAVIVYATTMVLSMVYGIGPILISFCVGAILGAAKVCFFKAAIYPLCLSTLQQLKMIP